MVVHGRMNSESWPAPLTSCQLDTVARFPQRLFHFFGLLRRYGRVPISLDQKHWRLYPAGHGNWRNALESDRHSFGYQEGNTALKPARCQGQGARAFMPAQSVGPAYEMIALTRGVRRP